MIAIIDYEMGNVGSIKKMLTKVGGNALITKNHKDIMKANKIVLPGVGFFKYGMEKLRGLNLLDVLNEAVVENKKPILGICLGMQLMTNHSEEGDAKGLSWINAQTVKFDFSKKELKVPHMGWNTVLNKKDSNIFAKMEKQENRFYFVHSYFVKLKNKEDELCRTTYGKEFTSAFQKENIIGMQFHPEKSHRFGMQVMKNFIDM